MKTSKIKTILEYIDLNDKRPLGASAYAGLIVMINNEEKLVEELLDKDYPFYNNLLAFLDYGLLDVISDVDMESKHAYDTIIGSIYYVLGAWNSLDEESRKSLKGTTWLKYLNQGCGIKRDALEEVK